MLSIQNLVSAKQAATYYELDDYYVGQGSRAPSMWWGKGARTLGLVGNVERETFARLLSGTLPDGEALATRPDGKRRVGIDLTFSAPKSVSLHALVLRDDRLFHAHEAAVSETLSYLEKHGAEARTATEDGVRRVRTKNLVVARFQHDTSRDLDPQLHTHAVVLNMTRLPRGGFRALTNEEIFRSQKDLGTLYRAELAKRITDLGYVIQQTHADGRFEIAGFTKEQLEAFSQRRAAIEERLSQRGERSPRAAEIAALDTRDRKTNMDHRALRAVWHDRAREVGIDLDRAHPGPTKRRRLFGTRDAGRAVTAALEHLSERRSVFFEREIVARSAAFGLGHLGIRDVETAVLRTRERGELLDAAGKQDSLAHRYTTKDALSRERALIAALRVGQNQVLPIRDRREVDHLLDEGTLSRGQRDAVRLVTTTRDRIVGVQGYAGTGKTTALEEIREIAEHAGYQVRAFATTAAAAEVLRGAGLDSATLAQHLIESRSNRGESAQPQLWILDEASMLGTREALLFLKAAERAQARVVLVGDRAQLPAIEAGKPFALLVDRGMATSMLDEIQRQRDPMLKRAVKAVIDRDLDQALLLLRPHVEEISSRHARLSAVAEAYLSRPPSLRGSTLVLTGSNEDRRDLNLHIRQGLKDKGVLEEGQISSEILVKHDLTRPERKEASSYTPRDVVRFGRSYGSIGVSKGECLEVLRIDPDRNVVELQKPDAKDGKVVSWTPSRASQVEIYVSETRELAVGDRIRFTRNDKDHGRTNGSEAVVATIDPASRVAILKRDGYEEAFDLRKERHWDHAYVRTIYSAQGRTAGEAILHIDTTQRNLMGYESFYVGLSRAQTRVEIFTDDASKLPGVIRRSLEKEAAIEQALERPTTRRDIERREENARGGLSH